MKEITSRWVYRSGTWNDKTNEYTNIQVVETIKPIKITIEDRFDDKILRFINGPTGFESYYIEGIKELELREFCICAGTMNSWPECYVKYEDIKDFIREQSYGE